MYINVPGVLDSCCQQALPIVNNRHQTATVEKKTGIINVSDWTRKTCAVVRSRRKKRPLISKCCTQETPSSQKKKREKLLIIEIRVCTNVTIVMELYFPIY